MMLAGIYANNGKSTAAEVSATLTTVNEHLLEEHLSEKLSKSSCSASL